MRITIILLIAIIISTTGCDECRNMNCQNSVSCNDGTCNCEFGYEGELCQTLIRESMLGTYVGKYTCEGKGDINGFAYIVEPFPDENIVHKVSVRELDEEVGKLCEIKGSNTFALQYGNENTNYLDFVGTINGDSLTITYRSGNADYEVNNCVFKGVRQ